VVQNTAYGYILT